MPLKNQHVAEADLERYSMHALPLGASTRLEEHLLICETCRGRLIEADGYVAAMRDAARDTPNPEHAPKQSQWRRLSLLPAFAIAALIAIARAALRLTHRAIRRR